MTELDTGYLLLIGAYRDNEVSTAHPLMLTIAAIAKAKATVNTITLQPLSSHDLNRLAADTLHCTEVVAQPLTDLVVQKTRGNPFFATQFLRALHQDGLIEFDWQAGHWQGNIAQVREAALTDDVVEFMALQLQKLPAATQDILKLAACIGNQFDLTTLAIVSERSDLETATILWTALQQGLVLPQSQIYKFYIGRDTPELVSESHVLHYRFLHDRVQQAAYSLIPDDQKQRVHLSIGQLLLQQTSAADLDENIFAIVSQFNFGIDQVACQAERDVIAQLNLTAARKARLSAAYAASNQYCETALHLVRDIWSQQPAFALELHIEAANSACLIGAFEQVDHYVESVCQHTVNSLDHVKALEVKIQALIARNQLAEAIQVARTILQSLGVLLPEQPITNLLPPALEAIRQQLATVQDVAALPPMRDPEKLAAMNILSTMASAAYIGTPDLYPLIVLKQIEMSLQFGNAIETPYAYATYGLILCAFGGEIADGNRFADLAIALMEQLQASRFKAKILNLVYPFTRIWQEALQNTWEPLWEGYQAGLETGDLEFAAYCAYNRCNLLYAAGINLADLQTEMQRYGEAIAQLKQTTALNFHQVGHQAVLNWLNETTQPQDLIGTIYDETIRVPQHQSAGDTYTMGTFYIHKLILVYHFGQPPEALQIAQAGETAISGIIGTVFYGVFPFYHALTLLANLPSGAGDLSPFADAVTHDLNRLTHWAVHAPMNFTHRCDLVRAEQQRVLGHKLEAIEQYDRAIAGAKENGYIQEESLANELAAKFYLDWGKEKVAAGYMQEAYYGYARWGAKAKTDRLENHYPQLLAPILQAQRHRAELEITSLSASGSTSVFQQTATTSRSHSRRTSDAIDFAAILKASQALSSEIHLEQLVKKLLQVVMENSGAKKAALLMFQDDCLTVEAIATLTDAGMTLLSLPLSDSDVLPLKLIHYVKRSLSTIVLD
ncbi:MAG: serine/threonine protein kinase, partial [Verrucomicrobia bacterium]|nr:serine/threonine protein kinase [Leptolyngbya sp. ES-bin-22]